MEDKSKTGPKLGTRGAVLGTGTKVLVNFDSKFCVNCACSAAVAAMGQIGRLEVGVGVGFGA